MWPGEITHEHEEWYSEAASSFSSNVLKKTASISQFLGQAEIDVLGVNIVQGKACEIVASDIAFHTSGLRYGSKSDTAARVVKKMFRTAITLDVYFPNVPAEVVFLSPKVNPATLSGVLEAKEMMHAFFEDKRDGFKFSTIVNEGFKNIVLDDVLSQQDQVADTSELSLRAVQLVNLFDKPSNQVATNTPKASPKPRTNNGSLPIDLVPADPKEFKRLLLEKGAVKYEHYEDGHVRTKDWSATRMSESSDVIRNLRSSTGYRQGQWQAEGMTKLVVKIKGFEV
jgi:hypothetical protein